MLQSLKDKALIYRKEIILGCIIFLVSVFSFALGFVTARDGSRAPIIIEACSDAAKAALGTSITE